MTVLNETNIFRSDDLAIDFFSWGTSTHKNIAITFTPFGVGGAVSLDGVGQTNAGELRMPWHEEHRKAVSGKTACTV